MKMTKKVSPRAAAAEISSTPESDTSIISVTDHIDDPLVSSLTSSSIARCSTNGYNNSIPECASSLAGDNRLSPVCRQETSTSGDNSPQMTATCSPVNYGRAHSRSTPIANEESSFDAQTSGHLLIITPTTDGVSVLSETVTDLTPAKQLNKLKRFLSTLLHLGLDISPDIGDCVRHLIFSLVVAHLFCTDFESLLLYPLTNSLSIEEFHNQLHSATNFPLRPFVVPFLKSSLPILQDELKALASTNPIHDFQIKSKHILFDVLLSEPDVLGCDRLPAIPIHRKRFHRSDDIDHLDDVLSKRSCTSELVDESRLVPDERRDVLSKPERISDRFEIRERELTGLRADERLQLQEIDRLRLIRTQIERERGCARDPERYFDVASSIGFRRRELNIDKDEIIRNNEFTNLQDLLRNVADMVENCQRLLMSMKDNRPCYNLMSSRDSHPQRQPTFDWLASTVQDSDRTVRLEQDLLTTCTTGRQKTHLNIDHHRQTDMLREADQTVKINRIISGLQRAGSPIERRTNHNTETRTNQINGTARRANYINDINDIEERANQNLQLESRTNQIHDRLQMDRILEEVKRRTRDDVLSMFRRQDESSESCLNCGRLATEACGRCAEARYCDSFCRRRHWETHRRVCTTADASVTSPTSSSTSMSSSSSLARTISQTHLTLQHLQHCRSSNVLADCRAPIRQFELRFEPTKHLVEEVKREIN